MHLKGSGPLMHRLLAWSIARYGHIPATTSPRRGAIKIAEARHPVPAEASVTATRQMLGYLKGLTEDDFVIALISGGASALMITPAEGLMLADKQAVNAVLLASRAPIAQMNIVRKHLSCGTGGQLAEAAAPTPVLSLRSGRSYQGRAAFLRPQIQGSCGSRTTSSPHPPSPWPQRPILPPDLGATVTC